MPRKNIYVRAEDLPLWERAEALAEESLSALLTNALKQYFIAKETKRMVAMREQHGEPTKRVLYVWGRKVHDSKIETGTSFGLEGTGPDEAQALVSALKSDPDVVRVELEERRVYGDGWVDRRILTEWQRPACRNCGHPLTERAGRDVAEVPFGGPDYPWRCSNCRRQWTDDQSFWRTDPPVPSQPAVAAGPLTDQP